MLARLITSVTSQQGTEHLLVFGISPVESEAEAGSHELECSYVKLKLRQLKEVITIRPKSRFILPPAESCLKAYKNFDVLV